MEHSVYKTEQEAFWAGAFGDAYIERNRNEAILASKLALLGKVLSSARVEVKSVLEIGANIGLNLHALHSLLPRAELSAVEINHKAASELSRTGWIRTHECSILDFRVESRADLVLCSGVLIHIAPEQLPTVYQKLHEAAGRYICLAEYYNPVPVEVPYRGNRERLFKRDFAGEMLDLFPDLKLTAYGFQYHRDPIFPADDVNWFLLERA